VEGLEGTEHLPKWKGRLDIELDIIGNAEHGVLLFHRIVGRTGTGYYSIADRGKLREWLETKHGDLRPIGLFIPFEAAWKAVKEFMETDGELPRSIPWIASGRPSARYLSAPLSAADKFVIQNADSTAAKQKRRPLGRRFAFQIVCNPAHCTSWITLPALSLPWARYWPIERSSAESDTV
jgi:hypothetical protein